MKDYLRGAHHDVKPPQPIGAYAYFDQVRLWMETPLTRSQLAPIAAQCAYLEPKNKQSRFLAGKYRQLLWLHRPYPEALAWVSQSGGLLKAS